MPRKRTVQAPAAAPSVAPGDIVVVRTTSTSPAGVVTHRDATVRVTFVADGAARGLELEVAEFHPLIPARRVARQPVVGAVDFRLSDIVTNP